MVDRLLPSQKRKFRVLLSRIGQRVDILRPDGTATENQFGKVDDGDVSRSKIGETICRRIYASEEERPQRRLIQGGRRSQDNPRLAFPKDTDVQQDDYIVFPNGDTYRIDKFVPWETHDEYRVEDVT